jgi:PilZ domain
MHEDDRRRFGRTPICTPVNVCTSERRDRAGMIRDVSKSGVLFHSRSKFKIGERVSLMFYVRREGEAVKGTTAGHVVRSFVDDNLNNMFQHVTAVRFDAPLLDLELAGV